MSKSDTITLAIIDEFKILPSKHRTFTMRTIRRPESHIRVEDARGNHIFTTLPKASHGDPDHQIDTLIHASFNVERTIQILVNEQRMSTDEAIERAR